MPAKTLQKLIAPKVSSIAGGKTVNKAGSKTRSKPRSTPAPKTSVKTAGKAGSVARVARKKGARRPLVAASAAARVAVVAAPLRRPTRPSYWALPYRSRRVPVLARATVATSQPLAAQAGLSMLARGGNAIDAALAAAITLTVVEPTMTGVGGDAFAILHVDGGLVGLNASGRSPRAWSRQRFTRRRSMPALGWDAVTVPGAVSAWQALSRRYGALPFAALFEPAITYAEKGFPVSPCTATLWAKAPALYGGFAEFARTFLPGGRAPRAGEIFRNPELGATLRELGSTGGESFYRGALADRIADSAASAGGAITRADLETHEALWVEPVSLSYGDVEVHELPPNGPGLAALVALGLLREAGVTRLRPDSAEAVHLEAEAMKKAFALCRAHLADPESMRMSFDTLLDEGFLAEAAQSLSPLRAMHPGLPPPSDHGTVYVAAADTQGRMVSFIQSNYLGFGSGIVVPGTGISLQNRGLGFSMDPEHPNVVDGHKRPYHTIMPGFLTRHGQALMSFGVMGGHMQPQGHVQLVRRVVDQGLNPQAACDAPRWHVREDDALALEPGFTAKVSRRLAQRGHTMVSSPPELLFGGAQAIWKLPDGYCAASDPRKDGQAVGL